MPATPAATAFCTISNDTRPLTTSSRSVAGNRSGQQRPAVHLVHRVVPPDVLADHQQLAVRGRPAPAACSEPVRSKVLCCARTASGNALQHREPAPSSPAECGSNRRSGLRSSTSALHTPQAAPVTQARGRGGAPRRPAPGAPDRRPRPLIAVGGPQRSGRRRSGTAAARSGRRRPARRTPRVSQPAASSRSWPGVRIRVAIDSPPTIRFSGASTVSSSPTVSS